jgi:hypothetical protein
LPGLPDGVVLDQLLGTGINNAGQLLLRAQLRGPGFEQIQNRDAVWLFDAEGEAHLLARSGQVIAVDDGTSLTLRTIARVFTEEGDATGGQSTGLNDAGQVALLIRFTDGSSGVFRSEPIPVPEPAACTVAITGAGLLFGCAMAKTLRRSRLKTGPF